LFPGDFLSWFCSAVSTKGPLFTGEFTKEMMPECLFDVQGETPLKLWHFRAVNM